MSLVQEQDLFLQHVSELIRKAHELGLVISGGELYRTPEQQALHVKNGRSMTMDSQHLKRLAVDLNFFVAKPGHGHELTYDAAVIRPLGEFWESLDDANRWGGNWSSFKDTPHFERRAGVIRKTVSGTVASTGAAAAGHGGRGLIRGSVGYKGHNAREDVETVQRLLNSSDGRNGFRIAGGPLLAAGKCDAKTIQAIIDFQRIALGEREPDGRVDPDRQTIAALGEACPTTFDVAFLSLLYLNASDANIASFTPGIREVMRERRIDTPLRQAHFLAQIGHESGELLYLEELASGEAYEGRRDLGNTHPGDGRRFKGRGLIQLTGRENYAAYGRNLGREEELLAEPTLVATDPKLCVDVAGWFWTVRKLNELADKDAFDEITVKINGRGRKGYQNRMRLLLRGKALLRL